VDGVAIALLVGLLVLAVVVVLLVLSIRRMKERSRLLQERFGPEYDREVESEGRRRAEKELEERQRRHAELGLKPLEPQAQQRFAERWRRAQSGFVNDPADAISSADQLTTEVMRAMGYPTEGYEQQAADLSVQHASALEHYRAGHEAALASRSGAASTEDLRQGMLHYRSLLTELLGARETR
jgi:hypothetical protein